MHDAMIEVKPSHVLGVPQRDMEFEYAWQLFAEMVREGRRSGVNKFVIDLRPVGTKDTVAQQCRFAIGLNETGLMPSDRLLGLIKPDCADHDPVEQHLQSMGYCARWFRDPERGYAWLESDEPAA